MVSAWERKQIRRDPVADAAPQFEIEMFLRACLKRGDSRGIEAVHLDYEKEPTVSHRSDRPSVELYQRIDPSGKAGRTTAQPGDASGHQCDLVHCREWMPVADAAA